MSVRSAHLVVCSTASLSDGPASGVAGASSAGNGAGSLQSQSNTANRRLRFQLPAVCAVACCELMTDQRHGGEMTGAFLLMAAPALATAEQRCARGSCNAIACSSDPATAG